MPSGDKCEWKKLKGFVDHYNEVNGTSFVLDTCLDVVNNSTKQPEVLLKDELSGREMVIEHKITVWPPKYMESHRAHHFFMKNLSEVISPYFYDELYAIDINIKDIEVKKSDKMLIISSLVEQILFYKNKLSDVYSITGMIPIHWVARKANAFEKENVDGSYGIIININNFFTTNHLIDMETVTFEIQKMLNKHFKSIIEKFKDHGHCHKVFVTEACGDAMVINHKVLAEIISNMDIPCCIDEVWIEFSEWLDDKDNISSYLKVKNKRRK